MLFRFLVAPILLFVSVSGLAADTTPHAEVKDKIESIQHSGAVKVEKSPAVNASELREEVKPATEAPVSPVMTPAGQAVSAEHLFGFHAAVGVPHPLNFGLDYVVPSQLFSFALSTGSFSVTASDVRLSLQNTDVALRWHPFAGAFFLGTLVGQQKIKATKTEIISGQTVNGTAEISSNYLTPHLGWMWGLENGGFFMSLELGYQSPSNVTVNFSTDAPLAAQSTSEYIKLEADVRDQGEKWGQKGLPYVGLLKLGWLF